MSSLHDVNFAIHPVDDLPVDLIRLFVATAAVRERSYTLLAHESRPDNLGMPNFEKPYWSEKNNVHAEMSILLRMAKALMRYHGIQPADAPEGDMPGYGAFPWIDHLLVKNENAVVSSYPSAFDAFRRLAEISVRRNMVEVEKYYQEDNDSYTFVTSGGMRLRMVEETFNFSLGFDRQALAYLVLSLLLSAGYPRNSLTMNKESIPPMTDAESYASFEKAVADFEAAPQSAPQTATLSATPQGADASVAASGTGAAVISADDLRQRLPAILESLKLPASSASEIVERLFGEVG